MAEPEPQANAAPRAGQQEEKKKDESPLEEIINGFKKVLTIGAIAAMPFLYYPFAPGHIARAAVTTGGFAAGKMTANVIQDKGAFDGLPKQAMIGNILSAPLAGGFYGLNNLESKVAAAYGATAGKIAKVGSLVTLHQPAVSTMRTGLQYGVGKEFKKNWWPDLRDVYKYLTLLSTINILWIYKFGLFAQMAMSATLSFIYNFVGSLREGKGSLKNLGKALNPFSYIGAGISVTGKFFKNVFYNSYKGIYDTGLALGYHKPK